MQDVHIGPLPPVLNGISVYLYRLSLIEKDAKFVDWYQIIGFNKFTKWMIKQIFDFKRKNFIFHPPSIKQRIRLFLMTIISFHKFSLVVHGFPLITQYNESSIFMKFLIRLMLKKAYFIQLVNPSYSIFLRHLKVKNKRIIIKSAYLPPPLEDEGKVINSYERELLDFIEKKKPLIIANAACIRFVDGIDGYGLDICIELTRLLKKDYPNIGFLFALANEKHHPNYLQSLKDRINKLKIVDNFYFMTAQKELWPIFKKADLMIRPTISDGDAISIRESLSFNCVVIASSVCQRPKGTILFKNRDINDLYKKCKEALKKNEKK